MFCPSCGKPTEEADRFCRSCGHGLTIPTAQQAETRQKPKSWSRSGTLWMVGAGAAILLLFVAFWAIVPSDHAGPARPPRQATQVEIEAARGSLMETLTPEQRQEIARQHRERREREKAAEGQRIAAQTGLDTSPEAQAKRERLIKQLISRSVFSKVEMPASLPHAWTGPAWDSLSYDEKQTFCGVVLAWYMAQNPQLDILVVKDYRTGKRIGSFDRSGLDLD